MSKESEAALQAQTSGKEEMIGALACERPEIYPITTYIEPRTTNLLLIVKDKQKRPIPDAFVTWTTSLGKIGHGASALTDSSGLASALFSSFDLGTCILTANVTKPGYKPLELKSEVNVIQNLLVVEIVNKPEVGDVFVNGQRVGTGRARAVFSKPSICNVGWGEVDGFASPQPAKLYANPKLSTAPILVEGIYRPVQEKPEEVKLTIYALITMDEQSGIPNPLLKAKVVLGDGREGYTDQSGKVEFNVKAGSGSLRIEVFHPQAFGLSEFRDIKVEDRNLTINVDFGPWFGGEESVDFTAYGADLVAEASEEHENEDVD